MDEDFDESILENEVEFKKRFRQIMRDDFLNSVIKKSLQEKIDNPQSDKNADEIENSCKTKTL
jgi:hypothetical protein